jgi:hypothetical protein
MPSGIRLMTRPMSWAATQSTAARPQPSSGQPAIRKSGSAAATTMPEAMMGRFPCGTE